MKKTDFTNPWFITNAWLPLRFLQIYVMGDAIVLVPFTLFVLCIGIFSLKWMTVTYTVFLVFRFLGEMMYWMMHQFSTKTYRPPDFGFTNLGNNELYVMYQLLSLVWASVSAAVLLFILTGWK